MKTNHIKREKYPLVLKDTNQGKQPQKINFIYKATTPSNQ